MIPRSRELAFVQSGSPGGAVSKPPLSPEPFDIGNYTDLDGDGDSDISDILLVIANFGTLSPQPWP